MAVINILDIVHCSGLKSHSISEAGYASIIGWNGDRIEPTQVGTLERGSLNSWTEGWKLACIEFLV
jgi:hypothetical protein